MSISLIFRSPYGLPAGRSSINYKKNTLLSLFQYFWKIRIYEAKNHQQLNGTFCERNICQEIEILDDFFNEIIEYQIPTPQSHSELINIFLHHLNAKNGITVNSHGVEIRTNDGKFDLRYYFLNNSFLDQNLNKCAFLRHGDILPAGFTPQNLEPCTYLYVHAPTRLKNSQKWDEVICPGIKLENFKAAVEAYGSLKNIEAKEMLEELTELTESTNNWLDALKAIANKKRSSCPHGYNWTEGWSSKHIYQLHLDTNDGKFAGEEDYDSQVRAIYSQVIVFDEVWAATYPHLAKSLQFYASDEKLLKDE